MDVIEKYKKIANKYDFIDSGTLMEVPRGWLDLVDEMCEKIKKVVDRDDLDYHVIQAKEKFSELRWYDVGGNKEIDDIVKKYEDISYDTCCRCGKPATKHSTGWICPWCDDCAEKIGGGFR